LREVAAKTLGVRLLSLEVRQPHQMDPALRAAIEDRAGAPVVVDDRIFVGLRAEIAAFSLKHRLATIYGSTAAFAEVGGLAVYGPKDLEYYRHAASYVDKIREMAMMYWLEQAAAELEE
jgi:hypothetical protein